MSAAHHPPAPAGSVVLFEDAEIVVIHRPATAAPQDGAAPLTLVTFADLTFRPDGGAVWAQEPAARLGLPVDPPTPRHVIVVVAAEDQVFGLLVDAVSDILSISPELMQGAPDLAQDSAKAFVSAVVAIEDRMIARIMPERMLPERLRLV